MSTLSEERRSSISWSILCIKSLSIWFSDWATTVALSSNLPAIALKCSANLCRDCNRLSIATQQTGAKRLGEVESAPTWYPSSLSWSVSLAVSNIMGMWLVYTSFFSSRHISFPSISGIIISDTMISGMLLNAASFPRLPLSAVSTSKLSPNG